MRGSKNPRDDFADSFSFPSKSRFEGAKFNLYSSTSIFLSEPTCQNKNIYMDFGNHTGNRQWMMNCSCLFIFLLVLSDRVRNLKGKSVISWAVRARIFCWTFNSTPPIFLGKIVRRRCKKKKNRCFLKKLYYFCVSESPTGKLNTPVNSTIWGFRAHSRLTQLLS